MRFKSKKADGYQVFAVSGTNTISFGIDVKDANTDGLLGFAVERSDSTEKQRYFMFGFKVFRSVVPQPGRKTARQDVRSSGPELRLGRFHRQAGSRLRIHLPSAEGRARRSSTAAPSRSDQGAHRAAVLQARSTTCSSTAASPAARPMRAKFDNKKPGRSKATAGASEGGPGVAEPQASTKPS